MLADLAGRSMIERAVDAIPRENVKETVIVLGHAANTVARAIGSREGVTIVVNPGYMSGMGSSIRVGLRALSSDSPGVLIVLADQPFVTRPLIERVLRRFADGGGVGIVAAVSGDMMAPPVVFSKRYFDELARLPDDRGAKSVIEGHRRELSLVRVRSRRELADVDSREDLEGARRWLEP